MKILVYLTGGIHWLGGMQYTHNLLHAICLLPSQERPEIVLHISQKNRNLGFEQEFASYSNIIVDGPLSNNYLLLKKLIGVMRRIIRRVFGLEITCKFFHSDNCSVAFPVKGPNLSCSAKKIFWVPDFQYKHFPEYFSQMERQERDSLYSKMFSEDGLLVLSSETVKEDFLRFFPEFSNKKVRILHFCSVFNDEDYNLDAIKVCAKYALPEKFVYLPNQMWQHKGFETIFEALCILRRQGITIPLVITGNTKDYRNEEYFSRIEVLINSNELNQDIYLLGMLPRQIQIQIYRRAAVVLQPSRFEGWNTSVEDARALGKRIILSNIDTHKEQDPPNSIFFETGNAEDLANKLKTCWDDLYPGPNFLAEQLARERAYLRGQQYARAFISIMREADAKKSHKALTRKTLVLDENKIAALHHLLYETLFNKNFGPYYSKMLMEKRQSIHPIGLEKIRAVKSTTGLKFNVNLGDRLGCDLYYGVFNEQADCDLFMSLITPGDTVIDVGANLGVYTLISALLTGNKGRVISFEPDTRSFKILESNLAQNKINAQIQLSRYCLGEYNGTVKFFETEEPCLSGTYNTKRNKVRHILDLPMRRLDDVLLEMEISDVSLIKIDVEGTESNVIDGAMNTLLKNDAILLIEISFKNLNEHSFLSIKDCLERLENSLDYQAFQISHGTSELITFNKMEEIFSNSNNRPQGNYFLARRTYGKTKLIVERFRKLNNLVKTPNRFFKTQFVGRLSKKQTQNLLWAERQRGLLAQNLLSIYSERMDTLKLE